MNSTLLSIASIVAGALLGGLVRAFLDRGALVSERQGMGAALVAEVQALIALIQERGFLEALDRGIARLEAPTADVSVTDIFQIQARREYFVVFRSLAPRLGVLGPLSRQVVLFYSLANALVDEMDAVRQNCDAITAGTREFRRADALAWNREMRKLLLLAVAQAEPLIKVLLPISGVSEKAAA